MWTWRFVKSLILELLRKKIEECFADDFVVRSRILTWFIVACRRSRRCGWNGLGSFRYRPHFPYSVSVQGRVKKDPYLAGTLRVFHGDES